MTLQMLPREKFSAWRDILADARKAMEAAGVVNDVQARQYAIAILRRHSRDCWPEIFQTLRVTQPTWFVK